MLSQTCVKNKLFENSLQLTVSVLDCLIQWFETEPKSPGGEETLVQKWQGISWKIRIIPLKATKEVVTSRCHGGKISGWQQTEKRNSKGEFALFQTSSIFIQFQLICQMLAKFSGVESERTVFKFRKEKKFVLCSPTL